MSIPAPRFDLAMPVELRPNGQGDAFLGVSVNMSETGMLVRAEGSSDRGAVIDFRFHSFGGTCEVIWTREDEDGRTLLGVRFQSMGRQDRRTLSRILSSPLLSRA